MAAKDFCKSRTFITIHHELNAASVDTTVASVATQLIERGFEELGDEHLFPFRAFVGQASQIGFGLPQE